MFDCKKHCVNHHLNSGWCAGVVSTNGYTTHMTALGQDEDWSIYGDDLGYCGAPTVDEQGLPNCAQYHINGYIEFSAGGMFHIMPCRKHDSVMTLPKAITVGTKMYSAIAYCNYGNGDGGYHLHRVGKYNPTTRRYLIEREDWKVLPKVTIEYLGVVPKVS